MQPILLPGTHVLRRGPRQLQVGLNVAQRVLADTGQRPGQLALGEDDGLARRLVGAGLAASDDRPLREALPPARDETDWHRHSVAAVARRCSGLAEALARRSDHVVDVAVFGHPIGRQLSRDLLALCDRAGLPTPQPARPGPPKQDQPVSVPTRVSVLLGVGEPQRDLLDGWIRDGRPHLVVRWVEGEALLGPFVVPGRTACLRCVDAHRTSEDPAWPLLVQQYARATRFDRGDGVPEPLDPALAALAIAWAVAELTTYVEGGEPATLGATLRLPARLQHVAAEHWARHPSCGCGWS